MKIEDIKKKKEVMVIIGSKKEVMAKLDELRKAESTLLETVNECWEAFDLKEKVHVLEKSGYELKF